MKKILLAVMVLLAITLTGCKMYAIKKYHLGREFKFSNKTAFLSYISKEKLFDEQDMLYVDSTNFFSFLKEKLQQDSSFIFLGTYLNDSTSISRSAMLSENTSCKGRIGNEIRSQLQQSAMLPEQLIVSKGLSNYHLKYVRDGKPFDMNEMNGKWTILLVYSYSFGSYYNDLYREVINQTTSNKEKATLKIVCIDPVYHLK